MKINKMLIAIPAMLAVVLSSCKDDDPTVGIDSSMPAPAEVSYDEMNSSSSSIGVYWDANAALKSGATSFTVQILKKKDVGGDAYDNTVSHTLQSSDSPYDASQFTGLTEGSKYFVRVRANYPRSVYSEWAYILSSYNVPAKVKVGTGVMHIDPNAKNGPEDITVVPFFSDLNLKWEEDDTAESYVIYIDDQKVGETEELSYHVTGLDYNTSYSVSVASVYSDGSEVKADPEPTKTGNIQQITRNVGPTHLSVNWDDVSGGAGAGSRAYQVELSKEESMANPIYSIYCVDGQASTNGSFGSSSWYGKENGTNLLPPTSISFGQLEPATTYYFRVKTVGNYSFQGSKGTVTIKATNGESDFSPVVTLRTEAEHTLRRMKFFTKDSTILRCSPISSIRPQAPRRTGPIKRSFPNKPIPRIRGKEHGSYIRSQIRTCLQHGAWPPPQITSTVKQNTRARRIESQETNPAR